MRPYRLLKVMTSILQYSFGFRISGRPYLGYYRDDDDPGLEVYVLRLVFLDLLWMRSVFPENALTHLSIDIWRFGIAMQLDCTLHRPSTVKWENQHGKGWFAEIGPLIFGVSWDYDLEN